jgi:hypothetical protein
MWNRMPSQCGGRDRGPPRSDAQLGEAAKGCGAKSGADRTSPAPTDVLGGHAAAYSHTITDN